MYTIWKLPHVGAGSISNSHNIPLHFFPQISSTKAALRRKDFAPTSKRSHKSSRCLIKISTADGKWIGKWNLDYNVSLQELQLQDLTEDIDNSTNEVSIALNIHKHTGFGLSVDGKIETSFTSKCTNCTALYCKEIATNFNVWVLPSSKQKSSDLQLPEIGGDDPSLSPFISFCIFPYILTSNEDDCLIYGLNNAVIYVKPGCEAELDSLIQDTIRLAIAVKGTCSEMCEKSEPKLEYVGAKHVASIDKRWSRLLELRKELNLNKL